MKRKKHKRLRCAECNQSAVGSARVHWLFVGSAGQIRSTSKSNNLFVVTVEDKWFCCGECFSDYMEQKMVEADEENKQIKKFLKLSRKKH